MRRFLSLICLCLFGFLSVGCVQAPTTDVETNDPTNSDIPTVDPTTPETTPSDTITVIEESYRTYDAKDNLLMSTNNIWTAIIKARDNSKSSNKCYVLDKDGQIVYRYSASTYYCYRSGEFVKSTKDEVEALRWAKKYPDSYVINGIASEFVYVGKDLITDNNTLNKDGVRGIENMSGCYSYMFSKKYNETTDGIGYSYMEFKVEFSKAKLKYFDDTSNENGWNAYVFVNIMCENPWLNCDMGIMQIWESDKGRWQPVFNHNGNMYAPTNDTITMMTYNEQTGYYEGADDLFIQCYIDNDRYILNITNLTTNVEYSYECIEERLVGNSEKSYILLAASNCPVAKNGDFWNPYCGNAFENVIFRDVKIAKDGKYDTKYDFYEGDDAVSYTLVMGGENASIAFGRDENGKYILMDMKNYMK